MRATILQPVLAGTRPGPSAAPFGCNSSVRARSTARHSSSPRLTSIHPASRVHQPFKGVQRLLKAVTLIALMPFSPFQKQPAYDSPPWGGFGVTEPESTTPTLHKMAGLAGAADLYMSSLRLWSDAAILAQFARKDLRSTPDDPNAIAKVHEANTTAQAARDVATAHGKKFEAVIVDYTRRYGKLPDGMENLTWAIRDHHNDMRKAATELARVNIEIEQIISHYSSATEQDGGKLMTWGNDCEMFGGNFEAAANDAIDELGEFLELAWAMGDPAKRDKRVTVVSGHTDPDGNKIETRATVEKQETTPKSDRLASSPPKASSPAPAQSDGRELGDYGD